MSPRFEAFPVVAATQNPIKEEDGGDESNRKPQRAEESRNQSGLLTEMKITLSGFVSALFLRTRVPSHPVTSHLAASPSEQGRGLIRFVLLIGMILCLFLY